MLTVCRGSRLRACCLYSLKVFTRLKCWSLSLGFYITSVVSPGTLRDRHGFCFITTTWLQKNEESNLLSSRSYRALLMSCRPCLRATPLCVTGAFARNMNGSRILLHCLLLVVVLGFTEALHFPWESKSSKKSHSIVQPSKSRLSPAAEFDESASLYFVARQQLLDFATVEGLEIVQKIVPRLDIPTYEDNVDVAVIGPVHVVVSELRVQTFTLPSADASTTIEAGQYRFHATEVELHVTFKWHWEKGPIEGTGLGELHLSGGTVDITFRANEDPGTLAVDVTSARTSFDNVDVNIHSFSTDWVYQLFLKVFHGSLKDRVANALEHALKRQLPDELNKILATVPSSLNIKGLPFKATFSYAIYTLQYVLVKGYGAVELKAALGLPACPAQPATIPVHREDVAQDGHMLTLYMEQSVVSCMAWALYSKGLLQGSVQDGQIPNVRLIAEVFAGLMPDLPKQYPKHSLRLDMNVTAAPAVAFSPPRNTTLGLSYTTAISVLNATGNGDTLHVATIATDILASFDLQWESTKVLGSSINSSLVDSTMTVNTKAWDGLLAWFLKTYAQKAVMRKLVEQYVKTPVTSVLGVQDVNVTAYDHWLGFSADATLKRKWPFPAAQAVQVV